MKITSASKIVIHSGSVAPFEKASIVFSFEDLTFSFTFKRDGQGDPEITYNAIATNHLEIIMNRFDSIGGISNQTPLQLGQLNGRNLYLNFTVQGLEQKILHYTWYLNEKELGNG